MIPIEREVFDPPVDSPPPEVLRGYGSVIAEFNAEKRKRLMLEIIKNRFAPEIKDQFPVNYQEKWDLFSDSTISKLLREQPPLSKTDTIGELAELDEWARKLGDALSTGAISQAELLIQLDKLATEWTGTTNLGKWLLIGFGILAVILIIRGR